MSVPQIISLRKNPSDDLRPAFDLWEPQENDNHALDRLSKSLSDELNHGAALDFYVVQSRSWAIRRSGIAIVDPTAGEGIWYSVRTVRATTGRSG